MDHFIAFFSIKVQQNLRVGLSAKGMPSCFEQGTQSPIIVDFAVKGDDELAVSTLHRLGAAVRKVDDRQAAMSKAQALILRIPLAKSVRTPRNHMITNAPQLLAIHHIGR